MAQLTKQHKEVDEDGVGKCSVPMWRGGLPAGFCDKEAYGKQTAFDRRYRANTGNTLYVPALACPKHGGPKKEEV